MTFPSAIFIIASVFLALPVHANELPGWEFVNDDQGVKVWRRSVPGTTILAFRGETVFNAPIAKVSSVLDDTSRRMEWVHSAKVTKTVRPISQLERVEYNRTGVPWPLKDRDFVFHAAIKLDRQKQQVVVNVKSTEDPLKPEDSCCVRGEISHSTYHLTSIDGGKKTHIVIEIVVDPRGGIPNWIVNLFQKSWPRKTLLGVAKQLAKPDIKDLAFVKDFFDGKPIHGVNATTQVITAEMAAEIPALRDPDAVDYIQSDAAAPVRE